MATPRDDQARLKLLVDAAERAKDENIDVALKAFELSQHLRANWVTADYSAKRRILGIMWLSCKFDGANLVYEMRKPFDILAEGLSLSISRDNGTPVEPPDPDAVGRFAAAVSELDTHIQRLITDTMTP